MPVGGSILYFAGASSVFKYIFYYQLSRKHKAIQESRLYLNTTHPLSQLLSDAEDCLCHDEVEGHRKDKVTSQPIPRFLSRVEDSGDGRTGEVVCVGKVKQLLFFPVKSARPVSVKEVKCVETGFCHGKVLDRGLAVVNSKGLGVGATREPVMTTVMTVLDGPDQVKLQTPGMEDDLVINLTNVEQTGDVRIVKFLGAAAEVYDCGDEAAIWISRFLKKSGYRVVYCGPGLQRRMSRDSLVITAKHLNNNDVTQWIGVIPNTELTMTNTSPVTMVTQASLDDVNEKLHRLVDATRFRTNVIVEGTCGAYDEDCWDNISIGSAELKFNRPAGRCSIIDTDPETGVRERGPCSPRRVMKQWRGVRSGDQGSYVFLCIHCTVETPGEIKVGDAVYASRRPLANMTD